MISELLTNEQLLELYDIVFKNIHSKSFKISEIKDFLDDSLYVAIEPFKDNWKNNAINYLKSLNINIENITILN